MQTVCDSRFRVASSTAHRSEFGSVMTFIIFPLEVPWQGFAPLPCYAMPPPAMEAAERESNLSMPEIVT